MCFSLLKATAPVKLPIKHCPLKRLVSKYSKGGISRLTPPGLASKLQSLPPILHKLNLDTMSNYSKAARGLSVFPWLIGIFTDIAISPSLRLRQYSDRYAIRAGQNFSIDLHRTFVFTFARLCKPPCRHGDRTISSTPIL
jgi:hypothetical protein